MLLLPSEELIRPKIHKTRMLGDVVMEAAAGVERAGARLLGRADQGWWGRSDADSAVCSIAMEPGSGCMSRAAITAELARGLNEGDHLIS